MVFNSSSQEFSTAVISNFSFKIFLSSSEKTTSFQAKKSSVISFALFSPKAYEKSLIILFGYSIIIETEGSLIAEFGSGF
jgi:hypothetical protein